MMRANALTRQKRSKKGVARGSDIFAREMRRAEVAKLYAQRIPHVEIARRLGVSDLTIHNDIEILRSEYGKRNEQSVSQAIAEELIQIDHIWREASEAWEKSKHNVTFSKNVVEKALRKKAIKINPKTISLFDVPSEEEELVPIKFIEEKGKKESNGDPRFMAIMQWCIDTRLRIVGLGRSDFNFNLNISQNNTFNWDAFIAGSSGVPLSKAEEKILEVQAEIAPSSKVDAPSTNGTH